MWLVELSGGTSDLAALAKSLTDGDIKVLREGEEYFLTSDQFAPSDDASAIRQKAEDIVVVLNGASRLVLDITKPIKVGAVYYQREGGKRDIFVFPEPAEIRLQAISPTVRITRQDGTVEEFHPADPIKQWAGPALKSDAIANVFRILADGTLDWVNLYRIFEIIGSDVGGLDAIAANDWATKPSMKLFKHTANSPGALGLEARHGALKDQPPANPMTISEARTLIKSIIHAWLRSRILADTAE